MAFLVEPVHRWFTHPFVSGELGEIYTYVLAGEENIKSMTIIVDSVMKSARGC